MANGFQALSESDDEEDMETDVDIEHPPGLLKKATAHRPKQQRKLTKSQKRNRKRKKSRVASNNHKETNSDRW